MAEAFPRCDVPDDFGSLPAIDLSNAINDDTIPDPGDPIREGGGGIGAGISPTLGVVSPSLTVSSTTSPTTYVATLTSCLIYGGSASFFAPGFGSGVASDWVLSPGQVMIAGTKVTVVSMGGSMFITGGSASSGGCTSCYTLTACIAGDTLYVTNDLAALSDKPPDRLVSDGWVYEVEGKCYTVAGYGNNCEEAQEYAISRGFDSCEFCGCFKLTETCVETEPDVIIAHSAVDTEDESVTLRDLVGKVVRLGGGSSGKLYTVESWDECGSTQEVTVQESYDDCDHALCYELTDCDGVSDPIVTFSDLIGLGFVVGQVVTSGGKCYTIASETDWTEDAVSFTPGDQPYDDCATCPSDDNPLKYSLSNSGCVHAGCDGDNAPADIVTSVDLKDAVGKFVKVGGVCYSVSTVPVDTADAGSVGDFQGPFPDCESCKSEPMSGTKEAWGQVSVCGTNLCQDKDKVIVADGMIIGYCGSSNEVVVEGTEC